MDEDEVEEEDGEAMDFADETGSEGPSESGDQDAEELVEAPLVAGEAVWEEHQGDEDEDDEDEENLVQEEEEGEENDIIWQVRSICIYNHAWDIVLLPGCAPYGS